jgi:UPF0042 nucleotide-binding protein
MPAVEIVSFGYLHGEPPPAHLTIDLRHHFKDPHVSPELRSMTAHDEPVRTTVPDGCAGGRHRAPVFAQHLAHRLRRDGLSVTLHHRDLDKPVVQR